MEIRHRPAHTGVFLELIACGLRHSEVNRCDCMRIGILSEGIVGSNGLLMERNFAA